MIPAVLHAVSLFPSSLLFVAQESGGRGSLVGVIFAAVLLPTVQDTALLKTISCSHDLCPLTVQKFSAPF